MATPVTSESVYPYTAKDGTCQSTSGTVSPSSWSAVTNDSSTALMTAIAQQPVSVTICAATYYFQTYTSGVLTSKLRCGVSLDHAVQAVGYGTLDGVDYYLVKNSWGSSWGDGGYVRIGNTDPNGAGICGIQSESSYPNF